MRVTGSVPLALVLFCGAFKIVAAARHYEHGVAAAYDETRRCPAASDFVQPITENEDEACSLPSQRKLVEDGPSSETFSERTPQVPELADVIYSIAASAAPKLVAEIGAKIPGSRTATSVFFQLMESPVVRQAGLDAVTSVKNFSQDAAATMKTLGQDAAATMKIVSQDAVTTVKDLGQDAAATVKDFSQHAVASMEAVGRGAVASVKLINVTEHMDRTESVLKGTLVGARSLWDQLGSSVAEVSKKVFATDESGQSAQSPIVANKEA